LISKGEIEAINKVNSSWISDSGIKKLKEVIQKTKSLENIQLSFEL